MSRVQSCHGYHNSLLTASESLPQSHLELPKSGALIGVGDVHPWVVERDK